MSNKIKIPLQSLSAESIKDLQEKYPEAVVSLELHQDRNKTSLTENRFWEIIALLDWSKEGDDDAVVEPAVTYLASVPVRQIYEFADLLSEKLYLLDGMTFAKQIGEGSWFSGRYFSVDNFLYARCCVVANGKEMFEKVLLDPSTMPKDITFEGLLYIPSAAYVRKTGKKYDYTPAYPIETYSNEEAWEEVD